MTKTKYKLKPKKIVNRAEYKRAKEQHNILNYISKQLPLRADILVSRIRTIFFHAEKWCKHQLQTLVDIGLIERDESFYNPILKATDNLKPYLKDLMVTIKSYEKILQKEKKAIEERRKERIRYRKEKLKIMDKMRKDAEEKTEKENG